MWEEKPMRENTTEAKDWPWSATIGCGREAKAVKATAFVRSPNWQQFMGQSCDDGAPYATGRSEGRDVASAAS